MVLCCHGELLMLAQLSPVHTHSSFKTHAICAMPTRSCTCYTRPEHWWGLGTLNGAFMQATRSDRQPEARHGLLCGRAGWPRPTRQHDAAEFLQHLCQRTDCTALRGGWEARKHRGRAYEVLDEQFTCPHIRLPLQRPFQIQEAIQQWRRQDAVYAQTPLSF